MVEGENLQCLDRLCLCGADLVLYLARQHRPAELLPHDGLQAGHGRERVVPEEIHIDERGPA